jgi:hypothetical protein
MLPRHRRPSPSHDPVSQAGPGEGQRLSAGQPGFGLESTDLVDVDLGAVTVSVAALDDTLPGFTTCTVQARAVVPTVTVAAICVALDDATVGLTTVPPE